VLATVVTIVGSPLVAVWVGMIVAAVLLLPFYAAFGTPPLWVTVTVWAVPTELTAWAFLSEEL
jgi:hypothetical protein